MLAPWFQAPIGSRMVCRHFQVVSGGGPWQEHLHLDSDGARRVPVGSQVVLTHARIGMMYQNPAPKIENVLWSDDYGVGWRLWSPQQGQLTPLTPFALIASTSDFAASATGDGQVGAVHTGHPPLIAPIVLAEGHQAFVQGTIASTSDIILIFGWVAGFVMPVVNDVPGNRRYFTEDV